MFIGWGVFCECCIRIPRIKAKIVDSVAGSADFTVLYEIEMATLLERADSTPHIATPQIFRQLLYGPTRYIYGHKFFELFPFRCSNRRCCRYEINAHTKKYRLIITKGASVDCLRSILSMQRKNETMEHGLLELEFNFARLQMSDSQMKKK